MIRILVVIAVVAIAALAVWHPAPHPAITAATPTPLATHAAHRRARANDSGSLVVYVAGAVARRGLYRLRPQSRVNDAVRLAGGFLPAADPIAVNLAARVEDGEEIAVRRVGETPGTRSRSTSRAARPKARHSPPSAVDVNAADAQTLALVPGIGAVIAARIVALREQEGAFRTYDELLDVAGMTPSRLERAQPYLVIR